MRTRVHRYLAERFNALAAEIHKLPDYPHLEDYAMARDLAHERIAESLKAADLAMTWKRRGRRGEAAIWWRAHRSHYRSARQLKEAALVFLFYGPRP